MDMPDLANKLQHVHFNEISEISEKLGPKHMLGEILDQCKAAMQTSLRANPEKATVLGGKDEDAAMIGITALLVQELSARKDHKHAFDINWMTSFESGTGSDLLYWYARVRSISKNNPINISLNTEEFIPVVEDDSFNLLRLLIQYPEVTQSAYRTLEPSTIMAYLMSVTKQLSLFLQKTSETSNFIPTHVMLCEATQRVLENGMKLLGITVTTN
jgi:arginyl-tRNA synthetase